MSRRPPTKALAYSEAVREGVAAAYFYLIDVPIALHVTSRDDLGITI